MNYGNLPPDQVFYYPLAADQSSAGDLPVAGDWNGDGRSKIGVFRHDGAWYLDANGDGVLNSGDLIFQYTANPGDLPIVGDWNHDGKSKTGVFRNGLWILDVNGDGVVNYANPGVDKVFQYTATAGDVPVIGDWNGDGRAKTGIYRATGGSCACPGTWILDADGDGVVNYYDLGVDRVFLYTATAGDIPVVGRWDGGASDKTGIFRGGLWVLDYNGDGVVNFASLPPDKSYQYTASPGDMPVVGDWNGDGRMKTGVFRSGQWILNVSGDGVMDYNNLGVNRVYQYTATVGDVPTVGKWLSSPASNLQLRLSREYIRIGNRLIAVELVP